MLNLILILVLSTAWAFPGEYPEYEYASECSNDSDCRVYHYCFYSYWMGATCNTNYNVQPTEYSSNSANSCKRTSDGKEWPDHKMCRENDDEAQAPEYSVSRCYAELDYTCHRSYMMPCTPNYDDNGGIIAGQEESCPTNFECKVGPWGGDDIKVCVPIPTEESMYYIEECETPFDCGFSMLEQNWPSCYGGYCERVVE